MRDPYRMGSEDRRRRTSRDAVVARLREHGALSRAELVQRTQLSRPTVSSIVAELQHAGLIGELGSSTILPGWVGVRAAEAMSERLGLDVVADNDANLGALAEWVHGAGRGCNTVVYVKISNGIGAGLIIDGQPFRGANGTAGELGHTVVDGHGRICRCGNRGCLETVAGAQALLDDLRPSRGELTAEQLLDRAAAGDGACRRVIADAGSAVGSTLATLCNLIDPQRIVIGGELAAAGELLLEPARAALARGAIPSAADATLVLGVLGDHAEVLGAVTLALRRSGVDLAAPSFAA